MEHGHPLKVSGMRPVATGKRRVATVIRIPSEHQRWRRPLHCYIPSRRQSVGGRIQKSQQCVHATSELPDIEPHISIRADRKPKYK